MGLGVSACSLTLSFSLTKGTGEGVMAQLAVQLLLATSGCLRV